MSYPRNLLDRAKPELLSAIAKYKVKYPSTADLVERSLKEEWGVSYLSYGIICDIRSIMWAAKEKFELENPWKVFERE